MTKLTLGQTIAGCELVYAATSGTEVVLRCPCGMTFPVGKSVALRPGIVLACPECGPPVPKPVPYHHRPGLPVHEEPTPGTKTHEVYRLAMGGMNHLDAARKAGVKGTTGEKTYYRYVLPRQLRQRIADLEAQLAAKRSA